jgi:hypothetical protein
MADGCSQQELQFRECEWCREGIRRGYSIGLKLNGRNGRMHTMAFLGTDIGMGLPEDIQVY